MNFVDLPRVGLRNRAHFSEPKRYTWGAIASAAVSAGTAIYSTNQQKKAAQKALDAQRGIADNIKYEPIDIELLKVKATENAISNATNSLAIERKLQPEVAEVRSELARQINQDLKLGGELPTDVINRVTQAGRVTGARSGVGPGGTVPLTASLIGLNSLDLLNSRRRAAASLLNDNPLQPAGLDPGTIASLEVAQNAAQNEFNLAKAGVDSSLADSEAKARTAQIGGQVGTTAALANLFGEGIGAYRKATDRSGVGEKTTYEDYLNKRKPLYTPVETNFSYP